MLLARSLWNQAMYVVAPRYHWKVMTPIPAETNARYSPERLLQIHVAEYNAITNRSTYYITIAASFWPVLLLVLTILVAVWNTLSHALLIWTAGIVVLGSGVKTRFQG